MGEVYKAHDGRLDRPASVRSPVPARASARQALVILAFRALPPTGEGWLEPDNLTLLTELFVWALDGRRDDLVATLTEERVRWARADLQYSLQLAEYFAILRENDRAFEWLENATRCGVVNYPFLSARGPFLANLRGDPRFEPLMAHVKTIWQRL